METINLYCYEIDFIKDVLRDYCKSRQSDRDARMLATDIVEHITAQVPDENIF